MRSESVAAVPVAEEPRVGDTSAARPVGTAGAGPPAGAPQGEPVFQRELVSEAAATVRFDPATGEVTEDLEISSTRLSDSPPLVEPLSE